MGHLVGYPASRVSGAPPPAGAIVFLGSADIETTNGTTINWWASGSSPTVTTPTGVHDRAWDCAASAPAFALPATLSTISVGRRVWVTSDVAGILIRLLNVADLHLDVRYVVGGGFRVTHNGTGTQLAISSSGLISLNTPYWIEVTVVIHDTAGSFTCKLWNDDKTLAATLSGSSIDTKDGGSTGAASVLFGDSDVNDLFEDAWIDSDGELYGPSQVETLVATGAGALTNLTPSAGSNWQCVDEKPVGTTDNVSSTGANQIDSYVTQSRSVTGTPRAVGVSVAIDTASGTATCRVGLRIGGVNYMGSQTFTASTSRKFHGEFWNTNPATSGAWTDADIDNTEIVIEGIQSGVRFQGVYKTVLVQL